MKIATNADELRSDVACAFVPTMGALHAGHVSLVTKALEYSDRVVMSIFINPLQFENPDDLAKYPRTPERDIEIARAAGVTDLWMPTVEEIYPGNVEKLLAGPFGDLYEGASRPGHFDGVLTVVTRLFDLVKPKWAIFGEKDFQQLTLVRTLKNDVEIIAAPTVREEDGLALSSRNVRLGDHRSSALVISRALFAAAKEETLAGAQKVLDEILATDPGFTRDYAEIIDDGASSKRAIVAGWVNGVRLIDNMTMDARA